ncbi:MAG: thermonuclease family protein [Nitrosopumilus sp.]
MGTRKQNLQVTKVTDGDTIKVDIDGVAESLRLTCLDTEESQERGGKPKTNAGLEAKKFAEEFFANNDDDKTHIKVDIEFDTDDPFDVCLKKHRDNFGRLLCYVHKDSQNYNLEAIRQGHSPYFVKYGLSRTYHDSFTLAERDAQAKKQMIWDLATNKDGKSRNYNELVPWWYLRAQTIQDYRKVADKPNLLSVRLNYEKIIEKAQNSESATIFCDLQDGIQNFSSGSVLFAGSPNHPFNLWIPATDDGKSEQIVEFLLLRYTDRKHSEEDDSTKRQRRNYVYVSGKVELYRETTPQIVVNDPNQISDRP